MNFEDIVDMDWLDSHTIEVVDPIIKEEIMDIHSLEEKIPLDYMPSTEQIKQLIELAKKQLALREQLVASCQLTTPEPESPTSINPNNIIKREVEGPISLETYAESDGIDIQKLTSKEKRQLRNKISARNFRVRRKG
jgi:hypothetical protein